MAKPTQPDDFQTALDRFDALVAADEGDGPFSYDASYYIAMGRAHDLAKLAGPDRRDRIYDFAMRRTLAARGFSARW